MTMKRRTQPQTKDPLTKNLMHQPIDTTVLLCKVDSCKLVSKVLVIFKKEDDSEHPGTSCRILPEMWRILSCPLT